MEEKRISFNIKDGDAFFADEVSITNNPIKFILDFKNSTPRIDIRAEEGIPIVVAHNTVLLDAWLAKTFHKLLGDHLKKYEKQFGKIEEPKQITQAKKHEHQVSSTGEKKPGYFG